MPPQFWKSVTKVVKVGQENMAEKKYFQSSCLRELKIFVGSFLLLRTSISRIIFQFSNCRGMIHKNFVKTLDHQYQDTISIDSSYVLQIKNIFFCSYKLSLQNLVTH